MKFFEKIKAAVSAFNHNGEVQTAKESEEPWVEVKGIIHDPHKGIRIDLDWNDGFVRHLRASGYKGSSDEAVVQLWLTHLYKDLIDQLGEKKTNEFE